MEVNSATKRCLILGSGISLLTCTEVVNEMSKQALNRSTGYICVSNVHTVVTGLDNPKLQSATNNSMLSTADGMPLVWASKIFKPTIHGRASGPDIMAGFFASDKSRAFTHALYGSTPQVLEQLKRSIEQQWPGTKIVLTISPAFGKEPEYLDPLHHEQFKKTKPHIVWVGLGAPKQEVWMAANSSKLSGLILIGVGAAFDFLSGNKPRAPLWMQRSGLEWLHRLSSEPNRLLGRYLNTNLRFIMGIGIATAKKFMSQGSARG